MSFEVYLQRFKGGEPAPFSRSAVAEIFHPHMAAHSPGERFIALAYPAGDGGTLHIDDDEKIDSLRVMSPGVAELFDDLLALMLRVGAVLYWPDEGPSMVIASEEVRAELPKSMMEALGPALVVRSGGDIIAAIKRRS